MERTFKILGGVNLFTLAMFALVWMTDGYGTSSWESSICTWAGINCYIGIIAGGVTVMLWVAKQDLEELKKWISEKRKEGGA